MMKFICKRQPVWFHLEEQKLRWLHAFSQHLLSCSKASFTAAGGVCATRTCTGGKHLHDDCHTVPTSLAHTHTRHLPPTVSDKLQMFSLLFMLHVWNMKEGCNMFCQPLYICIELLYGTDGWGLNVRGEGVMEFHCQVSNYQICWGLSKYTHTQPAPRQDEARPREKSRQYDELTDPPPTPGKTIASTALAAA